MTADQFAEVLEAGFWSVAFGRLRLSKGRYADRFRPRREGRGGKQAASNETVDVGEPE